MSILYFYIFLCFYFFVRTTNGIDVGISTTEKVFNVNDVIVSYLSVPFYGDNYMFAYVNDINHGTKEIEVYRKENGKTSWKVYGKIEVDADRPIRVDNTFVINNKIILFYHYKSGLYITKSTDGVVWKKPEQVIVHDVDFFIHNFKMYFTTDIYPNGNIKNNIYLCLEKIDNETNLKLIMKCYLSSDEGKTWYWGYNFYILDKEENLKLQNVYFFSGYFHLNMMKNSAISKIYKCTEGVGNDYLCHHFSFIGIEGYKIYDIFEANSYIFPVLSDLGNNIYAAISYDNVNAKIIGAYIEGYLPCIIIEDNSTALLLRTDAQGRVTETKIKGLQARKAGCEMVKENEPNLEYTHAFHYVSEESKYYCTINYRESEVEDDGLYNTFYIKINSRYELDMGNCFFYSFLDDRLLNDRTNIILIKKLTDDPESEMSIYKFIFLLMFREILFNGMSVKCESTDGEVIINFIFNNMKPMLEIPLWGGGNYAINENDLVKMSSHAKLPVEDRGLNFPIGIFEVPQKTLSKIDEKKYGLKKNNVSYSSFYANNQYTFYFQAPMVIPPELDTSYDIIPFDESGTTTKYNFESSKKYIPVYAGVDITDSTSTYSNTLPSVNSSKVIYNRISLLKSKGELVTIGLVCPTHDLKDYTCFDEVFNDNYDLINIHTLMNDIDVFVAPKRKLFNEKRKETILESLLLIDKNAIDKIILYGKDISFKCACIYEYHEIQINFTISAIDEEDNYLITDFVVGENGLRHIFGTSYLESLEAKYKKENDKEKVTPEGGADVPPSLFNGDENNLVLDRNGNHEIKYNALDNTNGAGSENETTETGGLNEVTTEQVLNHSVLFSLNNFFVFIFLYVYYML